MDDMTMVSLPLYREPIEEKNDGSGAVDGDTGGDSTGGQAGGGPGRGAAGDRESAPAVQRERVRDLPDGRELPPRPGGWTGEHPVQRHRKPARHNVQRSGAKAFGDHLLALLIFSGTIPFVYAVQSVTLLVFELNDFSMLQVAWTMYLLAGIKWLWGWAGNIRRGQV